MFRSRRLSSDAPFYALDDTRTTVSKTRPGYDSGDTHGSSLRDLVQSLAVELGLVQRTSRLKVFAFKLEPLASLLGSHDASFLYQHGRGHWAVLDCRRMRERLFLHHHWRGLALVDIRKAI